MQKLIIILYVLMSYFPVSSQELETNMKYIEYNYLHDYMDCDVAVYGIIIDCKITDSMGMYTRQLVTVKVQNSFKEKVDTVVQFFDFVESKIPLYSPQDTFGFFLVKYVDTNNVLHYSKIENSGFRDYQFIDSIDSNPSLLAFYLQKMTATYEAAYRPQWVKVKPLENIQFNIEVNQTVRFQLQEAIPIWNLKKGAIINVIVWGNGYSYHHDHKQLNQEDTYLLPLELQEENESQEFTTISKFILDKW